MNLRPNVGSTFFLRNSQAISKRKRGNLNIEKTGEEITMMNLQLKYAVLKEQGQILIKLSAN